MKALCGADCESCGYGKGNSCEGCVKSEGCPFGRQCFIYDYIKTGGKEQYEIFKSSLVKEINELSTDGMPQITELYELNGAYVNPAYPMPNGFEIKMLDNKDIYLGTQVESEYGTCFGVVCNMDFILISEYDKNCENAQLVMYKRR